MSEKFNIKYDDYSNHLESIWRNLFVEKKNSDVTLICEDGIQFQVDRFILSSCSSVFKNLLVDHPDSSAQIQLGDVDHQVLESILQLVYTGEATVRPDTMEEILRLADNLEIKAISRVSHSADTLQCEVIDDKDTAGILQNEIKKKDDSAGILQTEIKKQEDFTAILQNETRENEDSSVILQNEIKENEGFAVIQQNEIPENQDSVNKENANDDDIKKVKKTKAVAETKKSRKKMKSNDHKKRGDEEKIDKTHSITYGDSRESKIEGIVKLEKKKTLVKGVKEEKFIIKKAEKSGRSGTVHQQKREFYFCDKCDFKAKRNDSLKVHHIYEHEGVRYYCGQCSGQFKTEKYLRTHVRGVHEGVKFPCVKCSYQATQQCNLKVHVESMHEGIRYPCEYCGYQATQSRHLKNHVRKAHSTQSVG